MGYVRRSMTCLPQNSWLDCCTCLGDDCMRLLLCCSLGRDIYDKDDKHIFTVMDGYDCCGTGILCCGICGRWSNCCAPGGDCNQGGTGDGFGCCSCFSFCC